MNRLKDSTSPYLLQHADNPVDWWPWTEEAFAEAARRDVPVMLSVGYAACHWCHVMAHESFEDPETAKLLNEHMVAVIYTESTSGRSSRSTLIATACSLRSLAVSGSSNDS